MSHDSRQQRGSSAEPRARPQDERQIEAQAALDQLRTQAGGALSGSEIAKRLGLGAIDDNNAPPLDWRLTPRNVILQLLAVGLFAGAVWLMATLLIDGVSAIYNHVTTTPGR